MRAVITGNSFLVVLALIVLIQTTIIGNNLRQEEVSQSLDSAMDYAFDEISDIYASIDFAEYTTDWDESIITRMMDSFCKVLESRVSSDGEINVYLIEADIQNGLIHIAVEEKFKFPYRQKLGVCYYEKAYVLA